MLKLTRRQISLAAFAASLTAACSQAGNAKSHSHKAATAHDAEHNKEHMMMTDTQAIDWANLTPAQWQDRLTDMQYHVLRDEGTERPFTSPLNTEKRAGTFACAGCALPLFTHEMKYNSGTGWPSFFNVIEGAIGTSVDKKLFRTRTEYHCARCGGHQGHVFEDGPKPTGLRYCNNGVALTFIAA